MNHRARGSRAPCGDDYDVHSLSFSEALRRVRAAAAPVTAIEHVGVRQALGRITAGPVHSPANIPAFPNSAVDGYAARAEDLPAEGIKELRVCGTSFAGRPFAGTVQSGECVRIMTGAMMPAGSDTALMQEHVERLDDVLRVAARHRAGENVRGVGEDIRAGDVVIPAAHRLQPADLGVLASLGVAELAVRRRLRAAVLSTGDELQSVGNALQAGELYDSNRYTLCGLLQGLGAEAIDLGIVSDERRAIRSALREAANVGDALITTGGVSVGDADYVRETLAELGQVHFWRVAIKPGRPFAFGRLGRSAFFGLPGNPVSMMVTFQQLVLPALQAMMGASVKEPLRIQARCLSALKKVPGRLEFQRGLLGRDEHGVTVVRSSGHQGSHVLTSMSQSNCFIVLPVDCTGVDPGEMVEVEPFATPIVAD